MERKSKARSKKKKTLIVALIVFGIVIGGIWGLSIVGYHAYFGQRQETYPPSRLRVDDFAGLKCEELPFMSNRGQMLMGYLYHNGKTQRGVVVMAHGYGGGGHNSYMDAANYFAQHGYYVFAFDATGNDRSEGEGVGSLPSDSWRVTKESA